MRIPVVLASDENIVFSVGVVMASLAANAAADTSYDVRFLAAGNVSPESKAKLAEIARANPSKLSLAVVDMKDSLADIPKTHAYVNHVSAYKMLIAERLPDVDKALYIDTDVIVRGDLADLYATDLGDCHFGGVVNMLNQLWYRERIARQSEMECLDDYVNAGVLLMNLAQIRREGVADKWKALLGRFEGSVDQHILNHVSRGRIAFLPLRYNVCLSNLPLYRDGSADAFASPGEVRRAYEDPAIFHFTLKTKPWDYYDLPYAHEWYRYFRNTPFWDGRKRLALHVRDEAAESQPSARRRGFDRLLHKIWKHLGKRYSGVSRG